MLPLPREEYVEQAYFFRILFERADEYLPIQDLLAQTRHELLATTKLPMAVDYLLTELKHSGVMGAAMARLSHYFTPFQAYLVDEAERERGRFDMRIALRILQAEADYRSRVENRQGYFFFQFEALSRNRLRYDQGLKAMSLDPAYDPPWSEWLLQVRRDIGFADLSELIYIRSQEWVDRRAAARLEPPPAELPILFGKKEGRIALANRRKDPLYLFAAMQRHLGYPAVPRPLPPDPSKDIIPQLMRRIERLETRIKLVEEEQREGLDITKFYGRDTPPPGAGSP